MGTKPAGWDNGVAAIADGAVVALDYDGTGSHLHPDAERAWRVPGVRPALQRLGAAPRPDGGPKNTVIIISGRPPELTPDGKQGIRELLRTTKVRRLDGTVLDERPIAELDEMLSYRYGGSDGRIYVIANHGAYLDPGLIDEAHRELADELFGPMTDEQKETHSWLIQELPSALTRDVPGVSITTDSDDPEPGRIYLEIKPEGVAVHTRALAETHPEAAATALAAADAFLRKYGQTPGRELYATPGSNVLDIQVRRASKGNAIVYLHERFPGLPIVYFGDDITDLAAMRELRPGDTAVIVGDRIAGAIEKQPLSEGVNLLRLENPEQVAELLGEAAEMSATRGAARQPGRIAGASRRQNASGAPQAPRFRP